MDADPHNLFDLLDYATAGSEGFCDWTVQAPFRPRRDIDVALIARVKDWRAHQRACQTLSRIEEQPWVEKIVPTSTGVGLRLSDRCVERMARNQGLPLTADVRSNWSDGAPVAVFFWNANATKALHVGHLRDIAVGNAVSAALETTGAFVERRSIISDMGRGMAEAMAGVESHLGDVAGADRLSEKSDHFVDGCYADYVKSRSNVEAARSDSLQRELAVVNDRADEIGQGILSGDRSALAFRSKVREWVISGHLQTLGRLGISFDRISFESEFLSQIASLSDAGLRVCLLRRRGDGTIVYGTGRRELHEMPLVRPDGVPTQHMRALAFWTGAPGLRDVVSIQVCGVEWAAHVACRHKLAAELAGESAVKSRPTHTLFHGMVTIGGSRVSAAGETLLLDDLIGLIEEEIRTRADNPAESGVMLADDSKSFPWLADCETDAPELAAQVALGAFLLEPVGKSVELDLDDLFTAGRSLGWDLLRARLHQYDSNACDKGSADPEFRFAVVRSELLRYQLRDAAERLDVLTAAQHSSHLARWYVERLRPARIAHVVMVALGHAERCLGLALASAVGTQGADPPAERLHACALGDEVSAA